MHHPVPKIEEEWLTAVLIHELEGRLSKLVIGIGNTLRIFLTDRRVLLLTQGIVFPIRSREVFGAVVHPTVKATCVVDKVKTIL